MTNPQVTVDDGEGHTQVFVLNRKTFSSGSRGWITNGRVNLPDPDGQPKPHIFTFNLTEIGSKPKSDDK